MKKIYPLFLFLASLFSLQAQEQQTQTKTSSDIDINNIDDFKKDTVSSDFEATFSALEDKTNFKKLRTYLQKKQNAISLIQEALSYYSDLQRNLDALNKKESELKAVLDDAAKKKLSETSIDIYFPNCNIDIYGTNMTTITRLNEVKEQLKDCKAQELKRQDEYNALKANLNIVKKDFALCQEQIDTALVPEYQDQEFRKKISIGFAYLLGSLLLIFIAVVFRSQKNIADYFFSDTGLQFITLFVLIIAIILFGILKILEGRELAAILAGISGYILGKSRNGNNNNSNPPAKDETASSAATSDKPTTN